MRKSFRFSSYILPLILLVGLVFLGACGQFEFPGIVTITPSGLTRTIAPTQLSTLPVTAAIGASPTPLDSPTPLASPTSYASPTLFPTIPPSRTPAPAQPLAPSPSPLPSDTPWPTPDTARLPRYIIDALMDYDGMSLDVTQEIDYTNTASEPISTMLLGVQPNRISGVFELVDLRANDQPVNRYTLAGQRLEWELSPALASGQTLVIQVKYRLSLPLIEQGDPNVIRPQIFGVTPRQVNLTDWYPMVLPYQPGSGWVLHDAWYYGEHLVYPLVNFDLTLRFKDAAGMPVIAASAAGEPITAGMHYELDKARDFALSMGRQLKSVSAQAGDVTVTSYFYPGSETAGKAVLDASVQAVQTYAALFGPYPHASLSAVQGDFNDGMEFDGLYYLSNSFYNLYDGTPQNYLVMVAAHETSHQWWFARVANDQNDEPWLDEALASYCEKIFYEKNHPELVDWWWSYRIDFYQPAGKIDGSVPSYAGFTPYTNAVYKRGAHFFEDLRQAIGDDAFFAFLKDYATRMDGRIATRADFFMFLQQHSQVDLSGLLSGYFSR